MLDPSRRILLDASLEVAWAQWTVVGSAAASGRRATAIIDPEALVLLSLTLMDAEKRLWDLMAGWTPTASRLLSVGRTKNLLKVFPASTASRIRQFAKLAVDVGKDRRWENLAGAALDQAPRTGKVGRVVAELIEPPALTLRLRLGFGVGVKPDTLAFLLGTKGAWASVKEIAEATQYTTIGVRAGAEELAGARLVRETASRPVQYSVDVDAWARVLEIHAGAVPLWRHWSAVFALVADLSEWQTRDASTASPYVISSQARDFIERHRSAFERNRIIVPRPQDYVGEAYLTAFEETVVKLARWMRENV